MQDVEATRYAARLAGKAVDDDDELTDEQQEALEQIEDTIVEAEAVVAAAKRCGKNVASIFDAQPWSKASF